MNTPESLLKSIAEAELEGGGFALTGTAPDADTTAIVLRALAPHRDACAELVARTLTALSALQQESGAFASLGTETAESTAQAVLALSALGIAPDANERFVKNGVTCVEALYGFATADGFAHIHGGRDRRARHRAGAFRAARLRNTAAERAAPLKEPKIRRLHRRLHRRAARDGRCFSWRLLCGRPPAPPCFSACGLRSNIQK